jgi:hypothetical protein
MAETPVSQSLLSIEIPPVGGKNEKPKKKVEWSPENEKILVEWCDVAQCYKWLNARAHTKYQKQNTWFTIPAIILSTISGTASFAQSSLNEEQKVYAPMAIGAVNIFIGILTTIHQYLKIAELNESHRVSSIAWDKYARNIRIELSKAPDERLDAGVFLKHSRDEFDRLMETSPSIPEQIIAQFMQTFSGKGESNPERKKIIKDRFEKLKKPDICNIIISAEENRHHWYKDAELALGMNEPTDLEIRVEREILKRQSEFQEKEQLIRDKEQLIRDKEQLICDKEREINERAAKEEENAIKRVQEEELKIRETNIQLNEYITIFNNTHGRKPLGEEIAEYFRDKIDQTYVQSFLIYYASNAV